MPPPGGPPKAIKGDEQSIIDIQTLTLFQEETDKVEFDPNLPGVTNRKVSSASTSVGKDRNGKPALVMAVTFSADLTDRKLSIGKHLRVPMERSIRAALVPSGNPEHPWLIDGWRGEFRQGEIVWLD